MHVICVWPLLLSIMLLCLIHLLACISNCMDILHFAYPFTSWGKFGLFSLNSIRNNNAMDSHMQVFVWTYMFIFSTLRLYSIHHLLTYHKCSIFLLFIFDFHQPLISKFKEFCFFCPKCLEQFLVYAKNTCLLNE